VLGRGNRGCTGSNRASRTGAEPHPDHPLNGNGQSLRDRLRVIVRQHQLDPALVKAYAADYCGVSALREANREQVEKFVSYLDELARNDRSGLICLLNSYGQKKDEAAA
jgi:hypothetical protein